jgi:DNA topoisomerase-1
MSQAEATFTATGTPATKGVCAVCGTGLYRMGKTDAHEGLTPPEVTETRKRKKKRRKKRSGNLVIVESPAKARTISRFLDKNYKVMASVGHVRDLLRSQISVDVENDFLPKYRVPNEKRDVVKELKAAAAETEQVYLATDHDREGEAIAWHLLEAAEIDRDIAKRVVFNEITEQAIRNAFEQPRDIAMNLVDAQQARRILDRLVGYNLSPLLWAKVRGRLSAGRVQSVALRLIVEREREIADFVPQEYWTVDAEFINEDKPPAFLARLVKQNGDKPELTSSEEVQTLISDLRNANYQISNVRRGQRKRKPSAPFTTSTLQQTASQRYSYTARRTMVIAQQLYEGIDFGEGDRVGLITYMRTDSTQVAKQAQSEARKLIAEQYGQEYLPDQPPTYRTRSRRAQEAHEAIRPTSVMRTPQSLKPYLTADQYKLYNLIWQRFVASQMKAASYDTLTIEVEGRSSSSEYVFRVTASSLRFDGFLSVYKTDKERTKEKSVDSNETELKAQLAQLPDLQKGDRVVLQEVSPEQHFTQPPPRYSDASLVRALEEQGIGRPSTYAPIISTLRQRGYIERIKRRLSPTEIGEIVNDLIVEHFPNIVDPGFTARMEEQLDEIAGGNSEWVEVVREFYGPFAEQLKIAEEAMPEIKAEPEEIGRDCPKCGSPLVMRHGRYGKFIGCSTFPECRHTEPWLEKIGVVCPQCGGELVIRHTRKGRPFYGCEKYPECEFTSWKRPLQSPCPNCGGLLVVENRQQARCIACEEQFSQSILQNEEPDSV